MNENKTVFGYCEDCNRKVESDKLIVVNEPLSGDHFYCNRCKAKVIDNIFPFEIDVKTFWMIADMYGLTLDDNGNYITVREYEKQKRNTKI